MKRNRTYRIIGIMMIIFAICFVIYALSNPQSSFPWSNRITYGIYIFYLAVTIYFIVGGVRRN